MRLLPIFLALFASTLFAQNSHFPARTAGWVTLGIDGGTAFQSSDVKIDFKGYGGGLTLAKNLAYRPGGLLSFDLRGRFLLTRSFGLDTKRSFGIQNNDWLNGTKSNANYLLDQKAPNDSSFVYQNFRNGMGELGLEGVLTFNRLRERTGIVFALFGGIGIDAYRTRIDQLDASGARYNYLNVNEKNNSAQIKSDLTGLRDGKYETDVDATQVRWMPAVGLELGYQITPTFVIGIGHKITFSRTDLLDGQAWNNQNLPTGNNDWHHYTNLHLRWDLRHAERKMEPPTINILLPQGNPYVTKNAFESLRARILHVQGKADVECYLNNSNQSFNFYDNLLETSLHLRPGRNEVKIIASNPAGRAEANLVIVYEEPVIITPPVNPPTRSGPEVRIVQPSRSPFSTTQDNVSIVADVRNVNGSRDIQLKVNGVNERFSFAENLEANVRLREGNNRIEVEANTPYGHASDAIEVIYKKETLPPAQKPEVNIVAPVQGTTTETPDVLLRATLRQVSSKEQVVVILNGVAVRGFELDANAQTLKANLTLREGINNIRVEASTAGGRASDEVEITYRKTAPQGPRPTVVFTQPRTKSETVLSPTYSAQASVENVESKEDITFLVNGLAINNFNFSPRTRVVLADITLRKGENTLILRARNRFGDAESSVSITLKDAPIPQPKPVVDIVVPAQGSVSTVQDVSLRATTRDVSAKEQLSVILNGIAVRNFEFEPTTQALRATLRLREGLNNIQVEANTAGGRGSDAVDVTYRKETPQGPRPVVTIIQPRNPTETTTATPYGILANIENVAKKEDITLTINGISSTDFSFEPIRHQLVADIKLVNGDNKVLIKAVNQYGNAEASATITLKTYTLPVRKPEVKILEPQNGAKFQEAPLLLRAALKNVSSKSQLSVTQNGKSIPAFVFDDKSLALRANLTLQEGENKITVRATTLDGTAEATVTVQFNAPVMLRLPKVGFTLPMRPNAQVRQALFAFAAEAGNITSKDQIKITLNDAPFTSFEFVPKTGAIRFEALLKEGQNKVRIEVSNASGNAEASTSVTYTKGETPPALPKVQIISSSQPAADPFNPNEASTQVLAQVTNINQREQITIKVNDQLVTNYTFDAKTGKIDFIAKLKRGVNTIEIKVQNTSGTDSASSTVRFI
jgi:hypothetical protein